jgi:hypothetical protein
MMRAKERLRCFACDRPLPRLGGNFGEAITSDGQTVYVGSECLKKVIKADNGYQPPLGGPKLYSTLAPRRA